MKYGSEKKEGLWKCSKRRGQCINGLEKKLDEGSEQERDLKKRLAEVERRAEESEQCLWKAESYSEGSSETPAGTFCRIVAQGPRIEKGTASLDRVVIKVGSGSYNCQNLPRLYCISELRGQKLMTSSQKRPIALGLSGTTPLTDWSTLCSSKARTEECTPGSQGYLNSF